MRAFPTSYDPNIPLTFNVVFHAPITCLRNVLILGLIPHNKPSMRKAVKGLYTVDICCVMGSFRSYHISCNSALLLTQEDARLFPRIPCVPYLTGC